MKWFLSVLLILAAALALGSGLLAYAMYVLLGILVLSRYLTLTWMERVTASRQCPVEPIEAGTKVPVFVLVRNTGFWPIPWLLVEDLLPSRGFVESRPRLRVKKKRIKIALLPPAGGMILDYEIHFRMRGFYQIGPLVLETGDLFGLHRRFKVGAAPVFVLVYPKVLPLENYEIASRRPQGEMRLTHRLFEDPTRIAGVRDYYAGDALNRIHWPATARTGTLHSKIYEPSTMAGATLVLDFQRDGYATDKEPQRSELAVTAVASIAYALYLLGEPIGLVCNGQDAAERVRQQGWDHDIRTRREARASAAGALPQAHLHPLVVDTRRGPEQFDRIRTMLARIELNDGLTMDQLLQESASRMPRNASIFAFLPQVTPYTAAALGNLRRRGYSVQAILMVLDDDALEKARTLLTSERIPSRHFRNKRELKRICRRLLVS